jgi:hypothetical protein
MLTKKDVLPIFQEIYGEILGAKISKEKAWSLFKATMQEPFVALIENYKNAGSPTLVRGETCDELVMSLAGVGRFEIITAGSRKANAETVDVDPRARLYVSSSIQNLIYEKLGYTQYITAPVGTSGSTVSEDLETTPEVILEEEIPTGIPAVETVAPANTSAETIKETDFFDDI